MQNLLSEEDHQALVQQLQPHLYHYRFENFYQRFVAERHHESMLRDITDKVLPAARQHFKSETLLPTYTLFAHYLGEKACLPAHIDDNACTYTLDYCLYKSVDWPLFVEDKAYLLKPKEALAYYGTKQEHWREKFPGTNTDHVAMIFFHFAEPDHWYFTKGPHHIFEIRGFKKKED